MSVRTACLFAVFLSSVASAEDDPYKVLRSPSAEASSYLQTNWNRFTENYHPTYVLDENPATAWIEGVEGLGEQQTLTLPLSRLTSARSVRVRIRNGYQKSRGLLASNAAPNQVRIEMLDPNGAVTGSVETSLTKTMGWQDVVIPMEGRGFEELRLTVLSAHAGTRYNDTCISDILVEVDSDQTYSERAEVGRKQLAMEWIAERVQAAEYFQNLPQEYPFHIHGYAREEVPADAAVIAQRLDGFSRRMQELKDTPQWYDVSMVRRIEPADGLWDLEGVVQLFVPSNNAWFEADGPRTELVEHRIEEEDWVLDSTETSRDKVRFYGEGTAVPQEVYRRQKVISYGRGTYIYESDYYARFSEAGRLVSLYRTSVGSGDAGDSASDELYTFTYDGEGKLSGWTQEHRQQPWRDPHSANTGEPTYTSQVVRANGG